MIRLMGILTGSALAIAVLLLVLGVPELADTPEPVVDEATPSDREMLVAAPLERETAVEAEPATEPVTESQEEPETLVEQPVAPEPEASVSLAPPPIENERHWYAFWSPFRSEIAADGFISELARKTGLDYRVVKLKPGIYEVAFAYSDDADIEDKLARISAATGLDMTGG